MERALVAAVLLLAAVGIAALLRRREPDAPTQPSWTVPAQLDRNDFVRPDAPWLVVVFTSATCDTCAGVWAKAQALESPEVAVEEVEATRDRDRHARYGIDAVPSLVVADAQGVVQASHVGPVSTSELWATVAQVRDGAGPPGDGAAGDEGAGPPA